MESNPALPDSEINQRLQGTPNWKRIGQEIRREVECPTFPKAIELVSKVAALAEAADHHPDMDIRYRKVLFALSTHSSGGITQKDFDLAAQINEAVRAL